MSRDLIEERHVAVPDGLVFVNPVRLMIIQMMLWRVMNTWDAGPRWRFFGSQFFARSDMLRADGGILVSRPDDENGWCLL